jgi:putative FmdB family regulatory protein
MPIYDYKCPNCGRKLKDKLVKNKDVSVKCVQCHEDMKRLVPKICPHIFPADGIFFEHASPTGERFHSRKEMKEFAKKNDLEFDALS